MISDDGHIPSTLTGILVKVGIAIASAGIVGAGTVLLTTSREAAVHEDRITKLEAQQSKMQEIDHSLAVLNGKVDVVNQKLDDMKDAQRDRVR